LIDKIKEGKPAWSPATLEETPPDLVKKFFDDSPYVKRAPRLEIDRNVSPGDRLIRYALPNEATIEAAIKGSLPGSGSFALTPAELISSFERRCGQKIGLQQKLMDVIGEYISRSSQRRAPIHRDWNMNSP
jgi:3-hydroxyisobutyryl-CoA hydrolase